MAVLILLLYSPYFVYILAGKAKSFENLLTVEILLLKDRYASRPVNWLLLLIPALLIEAAYFVLAYFALRDTPLLWLTAAFALLELYHLIRYLWHFGGFAAGRLPVDRFVSWRLERISTLVFYTHAVLGIILILWP